MSPVDYHAWTHRPKEDGGTDPIQFPEATAPAIEWSVIKSTTSWEDTGTRMEFTEFHNSYDGDTFGLDGDDNLTIGKGGFYGFHVYQHGTPTTGAGTEWVHLKHTYERTAGPAIIGQHNSWNTGFPVFKLAFVANDPLYAQGAGLPFFHDFFDADMAGDYSTPLTIEVTGQIFFDGIAAGPVSPDVRIFVIRYGDTLP